MDDPQDVELELQARSQELTAPRQQECLSCYLERMLEQFGCAGHRFTRRWARSRPRGTEEGLLRWASSSGGCCCDCEVVMNSLSGVGARRRAGVLCAAAQERLICDDDVARDRRLPTCSGVTGGR